MAATLEFDGIIAPIPTPFDSHGDVHRAALSDNVRRWAGTRLLGLLALGSNGEAVLLDEDESDAVLATVRDAWPADRLLLAGVGRESTRATMAAARRAAGHGADAVLVRTPAAFRGQMTDDAQTAHFTAVADASPVPVLLYNLPGITGYSLTASVVATLARHPNIVGLKETSPDLERLGRFAAEGRDGFAVLTGWAPVLHPAMVAGATGGILAVANLIPNACTTLHAHVRAGDHVSAAALQRRLNPLARLVSSVHGIAGLKFGLDQVGYYGGPVRSPLLSAPPAACDEIRAALAEWTSR